MLGLERHTVRLEPHDPGWHRRFTEEQRRIVEATGLESSHIQHVGSTAVPGLRAKPILDIDIGFDEDSEVPHLIECLTQLGFIDRGLKVC